MPACPESVSTATPSCRTTSRTNASPTTWRSTTCSVSSAPSDPNASSTSSCCSSRSASFLGDAASGAARMRSSLPARLLDSPVLRCKANLLTRLHGLDELVGPVDTQSVYVTIANPLHLLNPRPSPPRPASREEPRPVRHRSACRHRGHAGSTPATRPAMRFAEDDPLDHVAEWGPTATPVGTFQLVPVQIERDLALISGWMNDPAVAAYWHLAGPPVVTALHLRTQLAGDGRSAPCLGVLDGTPIGYWEIYRADLDPLARHYPARPHRHAGSTSSSASPPTGGEDSAAPSSKPSPSSSSTDVPPAPVSSPNPTFATHPPCPHSCARASASRVRWSCPASGPPSWSGSGSCAMRRSAVVPGGTVRRRRHFWYTARGDLVPTGFERSGCAPRPIGFATRTVRSPRQPITSDMSWSPSMPIDRHPTDPEVLIRSPAPGATPRLSVLGRRVVAL
ncbi:hypothetical protein SGLAM104S_02418 [Streptomyces glaucescens]